MTERIVVGITRVGRRDWLDAEGCYWRWDKAARNWRHDRASCREHWRNHGRITP